MSKIFTLLSGLLLPLTALAYTPEQTQVIKAQAANPLRFAVKAAERHNLTATPDGTRRNAAQSPDMQLGKNSSYGFLDSPDGASWTFTARYDITSVQVSPYYTENNITGFTFTVYDQNGKELGTVKDNIRFEGQETRVADLDLDATVTKKFFNLDDKYEVIVYVAYNNPDYTVTTRSYVYSLGSPLNADGLNEPVYKFDGYIIAADNAPLDRWNENFYISVLTETPYDDTAQTMADFAASKHMIVTSYKKASYYNPEPQPFHTFEVPLPNLPGDQMSVPFFMSGKVNGEFTIVTSEYEKWFFSNAIGPGFDDQGNVDDTEGLPFEDNNLIVSVYTYSGSGDPVLKQQTKIKAEQTDPSSDVLFIYYSVGNLQHLLDVMDNGNLNICIQKYLRSNDDEYLLSYKRYDAQGNFIFDLAENVNSLMAMSDLPGKEPQVMFVKLKSDSEEDNSAADFIFVDIISGNQVMTLPSVYNEWSLRANVDRALNPDGTYSYLFQTNNNYLDASLNVVEQLVWINTQGNITAIDRQNLGGDIALAQVYISSEALTPYLFNTDAAREYMWLVKRYTGESTSTRTELLVLNNQGSTLFTQGPDAQKGNLLSIVLLNTATDPRLMISFVDDDYAYTQDFYNLPLVKFNDGGQGTPENPYLISTFGDFNQIRNNPAAHYRLTADIDAAGYTMNTITADFTGTIDGAGHTITGLNLTGAIFNTIMGSAAQIKDLNFRGVTFNNPGLSTEGVLARTISGATVSNVHFNGITVTGATSDSALGVFAGRAALNCNISDCSVTSADIDLPQADDVAGIASSALTGSRITRCAVIATITGHTGVGGIVANAGTDVVISDCHADVELHAMNTVGGIAASVQDATVQRCYTEGSITTYGSTSIWSDLGPRAGGIVGDFSSGPQPEGQVAEEDCLIRNNFVNMTAIKSYTSEKAEQYAGQHDTAHRIVGRSQANEMPDITGYDSDWNPIYGEPNSPERRLYNNFASESLMPLSAGIEPLTDTTEGATVADNDLSKNWFADNLGFTYAAEQAWNPDSDFDPALAFETGSYCTPETIVVEEGELYDITVVFVSRHAVTADNAIDGFYFTCNESVTTMTGEFTYAHNALTVEFEALSVGETTVDMCGAKCLVKVVEQGLGSISDSVADADMPIITIDGAGVHAAGCLITVYGVNGQALASANSLVKLDSLRPGIYLARAVDTNGHTAIRKFIVK